MNNVSNSISLRLMQYYRKILSILFLGIFSTLLLHQFSPHVHHNHDKSNVSFESADHHHDKDHEEKEGVDHSDSFLGFILERHVHSHHARDCTFTNELAKQNIKIRVFSFYGLPIEYWKDQKPLIYHLTDVSTSIYLSTLSLRGPPLFG